MIKKNLNFNSTYLEEMANTSSKNLSSQEFNNSIKYIYIRQQPASS